MVAQTCLCPIDRQLINDKSGSLERKKVLCCLHLPLHFRGPYRKLLRSILLILFAKGLIQNQLWLNLHAWHHSMFFASSSVQLFVISPAFVVILQVYLLLNSFGFTLFSKKTAYFTSISPLAFKSNMLKIARKKKRKKKKTEKYCSKAFT